MGQIKENYNQTLLSLVNVSSSQNTSSVDVRDTTCLSVQAVLLTSVSSLSATIKLQASLDNTNWTDISGSTLNILSSSLTYFWNVSDVGFSFIRAVYTYTAGVGVASMSVSLAKKSDVV